MNWFVWALLCAVFWAFSAVAAKYVADHEVEDPVVISVFVGVPLFVVTGGLAWYLGGVPGDVSVLDVVAGVLYGAALIVFYRGMEAEEVSRFSPTVGLSGVFVIVLAWVFLGSSLSVAAVVAACAVILGGFALCLEDPLRDVTELHSEAGFYLGLGCASLFAVRDVLVEWGTGSASYPTVLLGVAAGGLVAVLVMGAWRHRGVAGSFGRGAEHLLGIGLLIALGYAAYVVSIGSGPVSLASAVVRSQALLVFVVGFSVEYAYPGSLHEELGVHILVQKAASILLILGGLVALPLV